MAQSPLPIDHVRDQFPSLDGTQVFLDNAGGSQALGTVISSVHDYLSKTNVQLGASYTSSALATDLYTKGFQAGAKYINAPDDSVVIGASTTQIFRNLSYALEFPQGSEIILSELDHEANIVSWLALAKRQSLTVKWWLPLPSDDRPSSNPKLTPENLTPLLSDKTVFVACTHASNILGTIHDIKTLASTIHGRCPNALFCVDAVAYAPHRRIDVVDLGVDFYSFSWYKVYGPHVAQMYASPTALERVQSLGHYFNKHSSLAEKLALAGASYELVSAIPAVIRYFETGGVVEQNQQDKSTGKSVSGASDKAEQFWEQIRKHEEKLQRIFLEYLNSNDTITVLGETNPDPALRVATISFVVKGKSSREVVEAVDRAAGYRPTRATTITNGHSDGDMGKGESRQFGIRWGHFYSKRLCEEILGLEIDGEGVIRVSMVHYNTEDEVTSLIEALKQVIN